MVVKLLLIPFLLQNTNLLFTTIMRWFEMRIVYFVGKLADYWVVKTFYTNYSVVYDCTQLNDDKTCKTVISWVFSRHPNLSDDLMVEVGHVTEFLCLNETQFYTTTHTHGNASSFFFEGMHYFFLIYN